MQTYHFHSADGERVSDRDGVELASDHEARMEAVRLSAAVLSHNPEELWHSGHWRVEVTDGEDRLLFTVITLAVDAQTRI